MAGTETAPMILSIMSGSDMRDTPPWARMSAGTRSSAITATAPASSAIFACSGVTTSMITPPLSISAIPRLTRAVPTAGWFSDMVHRLLKQVLGTQIVPTPTLAADGQSTTRWPAWAVRPAHYRPFHPFGHVRSGRCGVRSGIRGSAEQVGQALEQLGGVGDHLVQHPVAGEQQ